MKHVPSSNTGIYGTCTQTCSHEVEEVPMADLPWRVFHTPKVARPSWEASDDDDRRVAEEETLDRETA